MTARVFYGFHRQAQDEERARDELAAHQADLEQERKAREAAEGRVKEMEAKAEQDRQLGEQAERERLATQEAERQRLAREKKEQEQREAEARRQTAAQPAVQAAKEKAAGAQAAKDTAMWAEGDRKPGRGNRHLRVPPDHPIRRPQTRRACSNKPKRGRGRRDCA